MRHQKRKNEPKEDPMIADPWLFPRVFIAPLYGWASYRLIAALFVLSIVALMASCIAMFSIASSNQQAPSTGEALSVELAATAQPLIPLLSYDNATIAIGVTLVLCIFTGAGVVGFLSTKLQGKANSVSVFGALMIAYFVVCAITAAISGGVLFGVSGLSAYWKQVLSFMFWLSSAMFFIPCAVYLFWKCRWVFRKTKKVNEGGRLSYEETEAIGNRPRQVRDNGELPPGKALFPASFWGVFGSAILVGGAAVATYYLSPAPKPVESNEVADPTGRQATIDWMASRTTWIEKGKVGTHLPGLMVGAVVLPERLQKLREATASSRLLQDAFILRAFNGKETKVDQFLQRGIIKESFIEPRKERAHVVAACATSHMMLLTQFMRDSTATHLLVVEDDLKPVSADFWPLVKRYMHEMQSKSRWDIFYLGYNFEPTTIKRGQNHHDHMPGEIWPLKAPLSFHGYIVTKDAARWILSALPLETPIDRLVLNGIRDKKIVAYGLRDMLLWQDLDTYKSTLGNTAPRIQFMHTRG